MLRPPLLQWSLCSARPAVLLDIITALMQSSLSVASATPNPCSHTPAHTAPLLQHLPSYPCRDIVYEACSKVVDGIMGHDVMKSVANLIPDLLECSHVLLYQGQFDAECGVASNEAWISKLAW